MFTQEIRRAIVLFLSFVSFAVVAILIILSTWPVYKVWSQGKAGEAELARAISNRKIAVQEAEAKKESAKLLAEAEIEHAKGVAEANRIIGSSLQGNEAYLRYLWIRGLQDGATPQVIYVPTEAGLPILEAGRIPATKHTTKTESP